jgi:phage tail-like protein
MEVEEMAYAEGGENRFTHRLPGRARWGDLTLKRGLFVDSGLTSWVRDAVENLVIVPVTVWVSLLNEDHEPLMTWTVTGAWPKKWSVADLNAETSAITVESLDLSYRYFRIG